MNARSRPARHLICREDGRRIEDGATLMARSPDGAKRNPGLCGEDPGLRSTSPGLRHFAALAMTELVATIQPVGWVELLRNPSHDNEKADGFRESSTHPTA